MQVHCVVETWNSGTSWYRVYSDIWCEQGGYIFNAGEDYGVTYTLTLFKAYRDNNYTITINGGVGCSDWQYANGVGLGWGGAAQKDNYARTDSFDYFNAAGNVGVAIYWRTAGYIQ